MRIMSTKVLRKDLLDMLEEQQETVVAGSERVKEECGRYGGTSER